jgi:hypothetical protein
MKTQSTSKMRTLFVLPFLILSCAIALGQSNADSGKPAFVTNNSNTKNTIFIPNQDQFSQFKIYKKEKKDLLYRAVATINSTNSHKTATPYSVTWIDEDPNAPTVSYIIEAYNNGSKTCDMRVIWQGTKQ